MPPKRLVMLPALVLAAVLVVIAYQIRMRFSGPDVPRPVSATIDHFAKGLSIGSPLRDARTHLGSPVWHPGIGYVGAAPAGGFDHALLIPPIADRDTATSEARVESVELFADNTREMINTLSDLSIVFGQVPRLGCIVRLDGRH